MRKAIKTQTTSKGVTARATFNVFNSHGGFNFAPRQVQASFRLEF